MNYRFIGDRNALKRNRKNGEARVQEIKKLAARGLSRNEIAKRLCLHPATVNKALAKLKGYDKNEI